MIKGYYKVAVCCCITVSLLFLGCVHVPKRSAENSNGIYVEEVSQPKVSKRYTSGNKKRVVAPILPIAKKKEVKSLAILLSEDNHLYQHIADAIKQQVGKPTQLFYLNPNTALGVDESVVSETMLRLQNSSFKDVVTIGSMAANSAKQLTDKRVVFSQVFNYQADGLLKAGFSGVNMIPSARQVIAQWKKISPGLNCIAIITGSDNEQQINRIVAEAKKQQILVIHKVVSNDKEMFYNAKHIAAKVQGFWLLPDHRILSRRMIKNFMLYAVNNRKQVVVFNRELLTLGGMLYVFNKPEHIATKIIEILGVTAPIVKVLDRAETEVNVDIVRPLYLNVEEHSYAY